MEISGSVVAESDKRYRGRSAVCSSKKSMLFLFRSPICYYMVKGS